MFEAACHDDYECIYDYFLTGRREVAMHTLQIQAMLANRKFRGSKQCWCRFK